MRPSGRRRRGATSRALLALVVLVVVVVALVWIAVGSRALDMPGADVLTVDFLDVGQGDAILVRCGSGPAARAALIDAGPPGAPTVFDLHALGVERLNLVIATHPHNDHIGSMREIIDAFPVETYVDDGLPTKTEVYASVEREVNAVQVHHEVARRGVQWALCEGVTLAVLSPMSAVVPPGAQSPENAMSVVLLLRVGDVSMLFEADAEDDEERAIVADGDLPVGGVNLLKVGHHGSRYSSDADFLATIKPRFAIISVGAQNRYGHPSAETLARLRSVGAEVHRTDEEGIVEVRTDGHSVTLRDLRLDR